MKNIKSIYRAKSVEVSDDKLTAYLVDGRIISQPLAWTPKLLNATAQQRANYRLPGGGSIIDWPDAGEDVCVNLMLDPYVADD